MHATSCLAALRPLANNLGAGGSMSPDVAALEAFAMELRHSTDWSERLFVGAVNEMYPVAD